MSDKQFDGLISDKLNQKPIRIHGQFFSDVLPLINDLAELKLVLYFYYAMFQKDGTTRFLSHQELQADSHLVGMLDSLGSSLEDALALAVSDNILLHSIVSDSTDSQDYHIYFLNSPKSRVWHEQAEAGFIQWDGKKELTILPPRQNLYTLYEENIGALTPLIADQIKAAQDDYPHHWIEEAITKSVENNVRRWRYIQAILDRWKQEGRSDEEFERTGKGNADDYSGGRYADFIES